MKEGYIKWLPELSKKESKKLKKKSSKHLSPNFDKPAIDLEELRNKRENLNKQTQKRVSMVRKLTKHEKKQQNFGEDELVVWIDNQPVKVE